MRKGFLFLALALILAGCGSVSQNAISADAAYSTFAEAEVAYASSGAADPVISAKLLVADSTLHDALKALSAAVESGNDSAIKLALVAAKAELSNIGPIVAAINNPTLNAALATIMGTIASIKSTTGN